MQTKTILTRSLLAASVALSALGGAHLAMAADAGTTGPKSTTTTEGVEVSEVIVTVERNKGAAAAPTKGNLAETQPESIITHKFIEQATPETGDYTTTILIAPSLAGIASNGGGVGETNKTSLRGFKDGEYNITYDGIFYGDTNDPTHHPASFWPSSTIGAAVVDRGPGAAGDLGQANYGGAIHFFSPVATDKFGFSQKFTYGTFNTQSYVTTVNSGAIGPMGTKVFLNFDERTSDGELSYSSGVAQNQMIKIVQPLGNHYSLTALAAHNWTRFYQSDAGPGETLTQLNLYGKNYALNNDPLSEHYYKYNWQKKGSDFEYIDFKGEPGWGVTFDDQAYTYWYSNKTFSVNDITGVTGPDQNGFGSKANTDVPKFSGSTAVASTSGDLGRYDKGNRYRVYGDILRVNKAWSFGTLKAGALVEVSSTDRHNILYDLTTGQPDNRYAAIANGAPQNAKTLENSHWRQYQLFADFVWTPTENLTITPGIKQVHLTRVIEAQVENSGVTNFARGPVSGSNTYEKTLYFGTINYRIRPDWSVYGQYATGFLIPSLSTLQVNNLSLNALQPQNSTNYQAGTVFTRGPITVDGDVYNIKVSNLAQPDPTGQFYYNAGTAHYAGIEGQGAYTFGFGLTVFLNGSLNTSKNLTTDTTLNGAPKWTDAGGVIFNHGRFESNVTYKQVGNQEYGSNDQRIPAYDVINAGLAYDFGYFKLKFAGFNLADKRNLTSYSGKDALYSAASLSSNGLYTFQAGRQLQVTLQAKF